jgi:hypothetical protein
MTNPQAAGQSGGGLGYGSCSHLEEAIIMVDTATIKGKAVREENEGKLVLFSCLFLLPPIDLA